MVSVEVQVEGLEELVRQANDPQLTHGPLLTLMRTATEEGQKVAQERARASSIASSILTEAEPLSGRVYSTLPQPKANVLEFGRKPGSRMPPPDEIAQWASRSGVDPQATFPIARAIAARGLRGRFFMRAARGHVRNRLPRLVADAAREIARRWGRRL